MPVKLTSQDQVDRLQQGAHIIRFPAQGLPLDDFDVSRRSSIETYEIQSINTENHMLGLAMAGSSLMVFPMPVDIGRLFISTENLLAQKIWWV